MHRRTAALALVSLALLAACDDDDSLGPIRSPAYVRVVNASPSTATVDVVAEGRLIASDVAFGTFTSQCVEIPSGEEVDIALGSGNQAVATETAALEAGAYYTLFLVGTGPTGRDAILVEDRNLAAGNPAAGSMYVRFLNATATAGQIYMTTPTGTVGTTPYGFASAGDITPFGSVSTTQTRARLFAGNTSPPASSAQLADVTISTLPTSRIGTVVFTGAITGQASTGFFVPSCS